MIFSRKTPKIPPKVGKTAATQRSPNFANQTTTFLEKKTDLCVPKNNFGQKFPSLEIVASEVDNFESEVQAMASELLEELKHASFEPGFDFLSKRMQNRYLLAATDAFSGY